MTRHPLAARGARLFVLWSASSLAFAALLLAGCSSRSASDAPPAEKPQTLAACDAHLAALATCPAHAGSQVAEEMAASRTALATRLGAAATGDDAARERMRATCASGQKLLTESCK